MLCLIDVQDGFRLRNRRHIKEIKRQISIAMNASESIMLVEMMGCGKTIMEIKDMIGSYPLVHTTLKRNNGGGREILLELHRNGIFPSRIKICGIYTNCCIADTIWELTKYSPINVSVIEKACLGTTRQMHLLSIKDLSSYKSTTITK